MDNTTSFGYWIRRQRKSLDLTQVELAQRVGCAPKTIEKLEADERRPSKAMAERLADALELEPGARPGFLTNARGGLAGPLPIDRQRVRGAIPVSATPLIGRAREVAAVCATFEDTPARLVTLIGPGGIGKTRVALQVAADLAASFVDGVTFIDLAPITDPDLVPAGIAHALGAKDAAPQSLAAELRDKQLLLVLDNVEQVVAAAPLMAALLAAAPRLKMLLTSRVVVGVYGEHLVEVPPLAYPATTHLAQDSLGVQQALEYEAIRLFAERARAVKADFAVGQDNLAAVVEICSRLEGLPLALELAAARVRLLPPQSLLARLHPENTRCLPLLTGGAQTLPLRHQTLRATIDWSCHLLDRRDQVLFRRLSVFVGGWSLEAAEAVCQELGDPPVDVLDGLHSLLDKSLLQQRASVDGGPRFSMMETIREYAGEQLAASGEREVLQRRHAAYFVQLAEGALSPVIEPLQWPSYDRLEEEHDNLRAVFTWSRTEATGETGMRLALALSGFWRERGHLREGYRWLTDAVTQCEVEGRVGPSTEGALTLRARTLNELGSYAIFQGDLDGAQPRLEESLALFQELGDQAGIAEVLADLGMLCQMRGDFGRAGPLLDQSLTLYRELGRASDVALILYFLGTLAYSQDQARRAGELWEESLLLFRAEHHRWGIANVLTHLAMVALDQEDHGRARTHLVESLTLLREMDDRWKTLLALEVVARLAAVQPGTDTHRGVVRAARLFGAAAALRETLSAPLLAIYHEHYQRAVVTVRAQLDDQAFEMAWGEGRVMTLEQAIAYALEPYTRPSTTVAPADSADAAPGIEA